MNIQNVISMNWTVYSTCWNCSTATKHNWPGFVTQLPNSCYENYTIRQLTSDNCFHLQFIQSFMWEQETSAKQGQQNIIRDKNAWRLQVNEPKWNKHEAIDWGILFFMFVIFHHFQGSWDADRKGYWFSRNVPLCLITYNSTCVLNSSTKDKVNENQSVLEC